MVDTKQQTNENNYIKCWMKKKIGRDKAERKTRRKQTTKTKRRGSEIQKKKQKGER